MAYRKPRIVLITGGAGFIGSNLAERLLTDPYNPETSVRIFDNLSRHGVEHNLAWLKALVPDARLSFIKGDVRDAEAVNAAAAGVTDIYHLAAQVAVTHSITNPAEDFDINARGTFNVLEAARRATRKPFVLFTSTNKVYGSLHGVPAFVRGSRYRAVDPAFHGVSETELLDFHSPYGCSKGAADQYVRDYARIYEIPTVVLRMSCIAGPRQFGTEDQGWVAHFLYSVLDGRPITIYGDGYQVRDVLHVHDLVDAMLSARGQVGVTTGQVYNLGGGPDRAFSITEMLNLIAEETGIAPILKHTAVRPGDQPLYISDTTRFTRETGWKARRSCRETLQAILAFYTANQDLLTRLRNPQATNELQPELVAEVVA